MSVRQGDVAFPSDDKRWRVVNATMRRHGYQPEALIETLHTVQESFGYLDDIALHFVSRSLRVPLSQAYGVATFYHFFSLKPQGKHNCTVCMGTACYIKGGQAIIDSVSKAYDVEPGMTTADNELSLLIARCVGACGLAPVVLIDNEIAVNASAEELPNRIAEVIRHAEL
jgi:bidirectional [NiFe] hydrogenase diaphorase subunit